MNHCEDAATWQKMRQGQPTDIRRCEEHGPKGTDQTARDGYGNRIWKRC